VVTACEQARKAISKWPGYQPTPLLQLTELAKRLEVSAVYCKDESQRFGHGSFKSLGGAYAVSVILLKHVGEQLGKAVSLADLSAGRHSELTPPITVCCATDGNHGRSVAWGAQQFGCECVIYIHGEVPLELPNSAGCPLGTTKLCPRPEGPPRQVSPPCTPSHTNRNDESLAALS
jgi:diaminopropionate ammonia-lyase